MQQFYYIKWGMDMDDKPNIIVGILITILVAAMAFAVTYII